MSEARLPATRLGLLRATRRLERLARGTSLLRRKREALVAELFSLARAALDTREQIDAQARAAWAIVAPLQDRAGCRSIPRRRAGFMTAVTSATARRSSEF